MLMARWWLLSVPVVGVLLAVPRPAASCSLCLGKLQMVPTFRQEASQEQAKMILFGTLQNPKLIQGATGSTELHISNVLRSDPALGGRKMIEIPRYFPVTDKNNPPRFLVFCDIFMNRIDAYRGVPLKSADSLAYVKKVLAMDNKDPVNNLVFFFKYMDHPEKELATDAYMEFAKAGDSLIGQVAGKLPVARLRELVRSETTTSEKLALFAFMLGVAGTEADASELKRMLADGSERIGNAHDGILCGLMNIKPKEGWEIAQGILRDGRKSFQQRLSVVRAVRFFHGWQPEKYRAQIQQALEIMIVQGELGDLAIEDMRRWQLWDRTRDILALFGKKGYNTPIMKGAVIRYALSCPRDAAVAQFLADRRKDEPDILKDCEEQLRPDGK
jgi:hypothetical protein